MNISFLGTGLMGAPMAERLFNAGYNIIAYNRTISKLKELNKLGIHTTAYAQEAIEHGDTIILMLTDYNAIKDVLLGKIMKEAIGGKTVIQMGTIRPSESRDISEFLQPLSAVYLEAPVLGSIREVKNGKLIVIGGGEKKIFDKYFNLFKNFGDQVVYAGKTGQAAALKLALNQLIITLTAGFSISLSYVTKNQIDVDLFMDILRESALYAPTFDKKLSNMLNNDFSKTNFPAKHLLKDADLIQSEIRLHDIHSGIPKVLIEVIKQTLEKGHGEEDYSSIYTAIAGK